MRHVYESGDLIPGFDGLIRGGTTIIVDEPKDVRGLQAICSLAPVSEDKSLEGIRRFLSKPEVDLDRWFSLWAQHSSSTESFVPSDWRHVSSVDDLDDRTMLIDVLSMTHEIWVNQGGEEAGLALALSIAATSSAAVPILEFEGDSSGLLFHKGSLIATTLALKDVVVKGISTAKFVATVPGFAVTFIRGRGIGPSKIGMALANDIRSRALSTGARDLPRLDELQRSDLAHKRGVIVFLHGLLSTYGGTFDRLIDRWKDPVCAEWQLPATVNVDDDNLVYAPVETQKKYMEETLAEDVVLTGWQHDTLVGIDQNGFELYRLIEDLAGAGGPYIAFACHSRGGLVARSAAAYLFGKNPAWQQRLCACLTFGTPHEGATLAESPEQMVGTFIALAAANKTASVAAIKDVLGCQRQSKGYQGIYDLRPIGDSTSFLHALCEKEMKQAPGGEQRLLDIFGVGGRASRQDLASAIATKAIGSTDHDLVVEINSSASRYLTQRHIAQCDHFRYFTESESRLPYYAEIIRYLRSKLGVYEAANARFAARPRLLESLPKPVYSYWVETCRKLLASQQAYPGKTMMNMLSMTPMHIPGLEVQLALADTDGAMRLAAYAKLYGEPEVALLEDLVTAVAQREDTALGQYWGLQAVKKTLAGKRAVDVNPDVVDALRSYRDRLSKTNQKATDWYFEVSQILEGLEPS